MSDIKQAFAREMRRLARKELKTAMEPLREQLVKLRGVIIEQRQRIRELERVAGVTVTPTMAMTTMTSTKEIGGESTEPRTVRLTPRRITRLRENLHLNQSQFARLLGVVPLSVSRWESGQVRPRAEQKARILQLRGMKRRELNTLMTERGVRKKRGRRLASETTSSSDNTSTAENGK